MPIETLKVRKVDLPVTAVDEQNLRWYANECRNTKLKSIAQRELARRAGGTLAPQSSQAIARPQPNASLAIEGNFRDPSKATAALKAAAEAFHLISPATMVGALPEGCAVALALVHISPEDSHLYKVGDKLALDKTHLASIANAIGASTVSSRRTDDGSHPHYCAWTVRVRFRQFDGTWAHRQGSVEMDLREPDGAEYVDAIAKARENNRDPAKQIRELRRFISRHAESKALNRAYAALGIRRSYTKAELQRPFCVARITFTGQSDDPVARAQFREGIMQSFLGSSEAAFGPEEPPSSGSVQLQSAPPALQDYSMPPTYDAEGESEDDFPPETAETADGSDKSPANPEAY
jgi:hypothetical protein